MSENTAKTNEPIWDSRNSDEPSTPLTNALETMRATARILSALTGQPAPKPLHDLATDAVDLLNAERAAKERAEARVATMRGTIGFFASVIKCRERWSPQCDEAMQCMTDAPPPIVAELDALKIEYASRAAWIAEMNKILGYDNADGFHSEPSPHEIARQMKAELERLRNEMAVVGRLLDSSQPAIAIAISELIERAEAAEKERDGLREGLDALIKGTIAAKEKSNAELEKLRAQLDILKAADYAALSGGADYGAVKLENNELRSKLQVVRVALASVAAHRSEDRDGNHVLWVGETTFLQVAEALAQLDAG